ncbi:permease-like cell division protein FtsX [Nonomuraea sp. NPDC003707]
MNSAMEDRLREALAEAGATVDAGTLRPLRASERRRFRVDFRLVAVAATVVLAGAATTVGLLSGPGDEDRAVAADPAGDGRKMNVFLCAKSSDREQTACKGAVSEEETQKIAAAVRQAPGVTEVSYTHQTAAYENFRRDFERNKALLAAVDVDDLPASFGLTLTKGTDPRRVQEALRGVPGILTVQEVTPYESTPADKWDVTVFLCTPSSSMPSCGAEHKSDRKVSPIVTREGKGATPAQREAIRKLIISMPGAKEVFFEDQTAAYENFRRMYKANKTLIDATKVSDMPQSFRIVLLPDADWSKAASRLRREPGVSQVLHRCMNDGSRLKYSYGLTLPESKVCPTDK